MSNGTKRRGAATGWCLVALAAVGGCGRAQKTPAEVEAALTSQPASASTLSALKESFPDDYRALIANTTAQFNAGTDPQAAQTAAFSQMSSLVVRHRDDLVHAPDAALIAQAKAQAALMQKLDEAQCAKLFTVGLGPTDKPPAAALPFVSDMGAATLRGARAGIDHRTERPAALQPADAMALAKAMTRQNLTPEQLEVFKGGQIVSAPPASQCAIGRAMTAAVVGLPAPQAARLWSFVLKES